MPFRMATLSTWFYIARESPMTQESKLISLGLGFFASNQDI